MTTIAVDPVIVHREAHRPERLELVEGQAPVLGCEVLGE